MNKLMLKIARMLMAFLSAIQAFYCLQLAADVPANNTPTLVSHIEPPKNTISRLGYEENLLRLALEKTRSSHGDFILRPTPDNHTTLRDLNALKRNRIDNFVRAFAIDKALIEDKDLIYIEFPTMRGSSSYRICFTSKQNKKRINNIKTLKELSNLTFVQGLDWPDKTVLEHAGFQVYESGIKRAVFEMVAHGRADLFCRGIGEYMGEWNRYKNDIQDLAIEDSLLIFYPFPRYFFSHKSNQQLMDRIQTGLELAFADGSFMAMWEQYHMDAIEFANLDKRRIFILENPNLEGIDLNYSQYFYPVDRGQLTNSEHTLNVPDAGKAP